MVENKNKIISIEYPENGKIRSRKVVTRSRHRATGKYPSWKMAQMVEWESRNELNAFRLLDASPAVNAFSDQPCVINYILENEQHKHYPDILVEIGYKKELWEIKPKKDILKPEIIKRTELMEVELPKHGYRYRVITDDLLSKEPRMSNILTILKFGRNPINIYEEELFRKNYSEELTWGEISNGQLGKKGKQILCRKILDGLISLNINLPITHMTSFSLVKNNYPSILETI